MNADLWQTELSVSRLACYMASGWAILLAVMIVLSPWYGLFFLVKPLALVGLSYEWWRTLQRLRARVGRLSLDNQETWSWQQQQWRLTQPLCWLPWGVMIVWRSETLKHRQYFWLMADSMSERAWRQLRFYWLMGRHRQWK